MTIEQLFASRTSGMKASEIRELLKLLEQPGILSFAGGIPDPDLFPADAFADSYAKALTPQRQAAALQYSVSEGYGPLRQWIANRMSAAGVPCEIDNILITSGSQQALDYLGKTFLSPGDTALVGWPTYMGALGAFRAYEPRFERLDIHGNRSVEDLVEVAQASGGKVKFAYLVPDFDNPTGRTIDRAGREHVLALADQLDCAILEDAAYQALRFDGADVPSIMALEVARKGSLEACRTIYCGSFSKTLSPGLRVGWVMAAKPVIQQLVLTKQASDLHTPTINQMVIHDVADRMFDSHLTTLKTAYRARRDAMLEALERYMPDGVDWTRPEGGMFVWMTLPKGLDGAELLAEALRSEKVAFVPGGAFFPDGSGNNSLRLNFSLPDTDEIEEGIRRLGAVLKLAVT